MTSPSSEDLPPAYEEIPFPLSVDQLDQLSERFRLAGERFHKSEHPLSIAALKVGFMNCVEFENYYTTGNRKKYCIIPSRCYPSDYDVKMFKEWAESEGKFTIIHCTADGSIDMRNGQVDFDGKITVTFEDKKSKWSCVVM
jgi:hypothetical protein